MKRNLLTSALLSLFILLIPTSAGATKFLELKVVDKEYLMVHFRDGEVHYRDDATGPSAYLGHSFAEGDDTLLVFAPGSIPRQPSRPGTGSSPPATTRPTAAAQRCRPSASPSR